ncbi:putative Oxoglutarate iron-dependent dioxygenase [Rosellinia necatrix]|uniref:Putative Oxoglutarate iron-dependent dioxygenase n=1 Tax=Rosellinia necatrix TaxID=77044 RepID=A0A1S8AB01_ROSNE|nr:putative Oxoglutarate iron-dependent dioxygenase [Rosellinia necatrix]
MATAFEAIPTIDLARAADPAALPGLLADLRRAVVDVGFLYVRGHGVPASATADLVGLLPRLFAGDDADADADADAVTAAKRAVALENSPHFLGYSAVGSERTGGRADRREQFEFATELDATWREGRPLYERLRGPNQWPNDDKELRAVVERYIAELTGLGERFLELVTQALSLPAGAFRGFLSDQHRLKLVRYPAMAAVASTAGSSDHHRQQQQQQQQEQQEQQGVGPHKDSSGWWTFLLQASPPEVGGLQVLNRAGAWVDVPAVPGTLVVNIGQAFEVVTAGVCRATTHRVLSGPRERFSVPFFQGVRRDLTKAEAVGGPLAAHFAGLARRGESAEAARVDSAFLRGGYDTWGESQLRTKVRSHRENGRKFYRDVYEQYINDDAS